MTTYILVDDIRAKLDWMNKKDEKHIYITYSVGVKVEFLDVSIENSNGSLITSVFHKPAAEPYVLPFGSDHPRHVHINIPYEALLRAARLCSNVSTFDKERLKIEMILLLNNYPPKVIKHHFNRFFRLNQVMSVFTLLDATQYEILHQKLLYLPTRREKKCHRTRTNNEDIGGGGGGGGERLDENNDADTKKQWNRKILMLPHTFEGGPLLEFKHEFRKLWANHYVCKGSLMKDVRLMITSLSNPSLNDLLVHKKLSRSLLTKMESSLEKNFEQELVL